MKVPEFLTEDPDGHIHVAGHRIGLQDQAGASRLSACAGARDGGNLAGAPDRVASADGLILLKLLAFRTQDQLDIENLVAANRDQLDVAWIQAEWQTMAPLDDPRMRRFLEILR